MKKVVQEGTNEIAEHYSDFNNEQRAYGRFTVQAGVGSEFKNHIYTFDVSDADIRDILIFIQLKLPQGKKVTDDQFFVL